MPIKEGERKRYQCLKGCIVPACVRNGNTIPAHVFSTDNKTVMETHEKCEKHLEKRSVLLFCSYKGCTYSTSDSSDLKKHELTHEKEARKLRCKHEGCTYSTSDSSNLKKHELTHEKEAKLGRHSFELGRHSFVDEVIKDNLHLYF